MSRPRILTPARISSLVGTALLLGLGGNGICGIRHQCMAGHMQHPPYGIADYSLDLGWTALVILGAWQSSRAAFGHPRLVAWAALLVVVFRFFGSSFGHFSGGLSLLIELLGLAAWFYVFGATLHLFWRTWHRSRAGQT